MKCTPVLQNTYSAVLFIEIANKNTSKRYQIGFVCWTKIRGKKWANDFAFVVLLFCCFVVLLLTERSAHLHFQ